MHIPSSSHFMCQRRTTKQKAIEAGPFQFESCENIGICLEHGLHDINWADAVVCGDETTFHS